MISQHGLLDLLSTEGGNKDQWKILDGEPHRVYMSKSPVNRTAVTLLEMKQRVSCLLAVGVC